MNITGQRAAEGPSGETTIRKPISGSLVAKSKTKKNVRKSIDRTVSKQDRVIAMLRRKEGATVAAVMKATGWQKHSVHGFFAGVVRKKLRLKLSSKKIDGNRIYRIMGGSGARSSARQVGHRSV